MLPDEFDANHMAGAPDDCAVSPLASRANASRKLAGNTIGSSVVTFAPVADKSSTMH
jgi:hypothetical protein